MKQMAFTASGGSFWDRHCYQNMRYYDNNSQHQKPAKTINYLFFFFWISSGWILLTLSRSYKRSYSCTEKIDSIISAIFQSYGYNCRMKNSYPLNGECLIPKFIDRTNDSNGANSDKKFYPGLADTPFKARYRNHIKGLKTWKAWE